MGVPWVVVQHLSPSILRQIGARIAELLSESQWTLPSGPETVLHTYFRIAFALATGIDLVVSPCVQRRRQDQVEYYAKIPFIDRDTGVKDTILSRGLPGHSEGSGHTWPSRQHSALQSEKR